MLLIFSCYDSTGRPGRILQLIDASLQAGLFAGLRNLAVLACSLAVAVEFLKPFLAGDRAGMDELNETGKPVQGLIRYIVLRIAGVFGSPGQIDTKNVFMEIKFELSAPACQARLFKQWRGH